VEILNLGVIDKRNRPRLMSFAQNCNLSRKSSGNILQSVYSRVPNGLYGTTVWVVSRMQGF